MKRKIMAVLAIVMIVTAISTSAVFANDKDGQGDKSAITSMFDSMRSWIQKAQDNGEITKEEANEWDNHFNDMEKYHEQNGIGHCGGSNNGSSNVQNQNFAPSYRNGMMGGFSGSSL